MPITDSFDAVAVFRDYVVDPAAEFECLADTARHEPGVTDLIGQRFDRLVVFSVVRNRFNQRCCECVCDCGRVKKNPTVVGDLVKGRVRSCGCLQVEKLSSRKSRFQKPKQGASQSTGVLRLDQKAIKSFLRRVARKVRVVGECHVWTGSGTRAGSRYGRAKLGNRTVAVHRAMCELRHGELRDGQVARHTCDNSRCVNPEHLVPGSLSDNASDMVARGRMFHPDNAGDRHWNSKLTAEAVRGMLAMREKGAKQTDIAKHYGVNVSTVCDVFKGRTWARVTGIRKGDPQ